MTDPQGAGAGLSELVTAVEGLDPAVSDHQPYQAWDAAKWRVFNAAVRFIKEGTGTRQSGPVLDEFEALKVYWTTDEGLAPMPLEMQKKYPKFGGWFRAEEVRLLIDHLRAALRAPQWPDVLGDMSMKAFQAEHANDAPIDPHSMVRFSQLDLDAQTKPLHAEIERLRSLRSPQEGKEP